MSISRFRNKYASGEEARHYAEQRFRSWRRAWLDRREQHLVSQQCRESGREVDLLDAPCGAGRLLACLSSGSPRRLVGVDGALSMLEVARRNAGDNILLAQSDILQLPFVDDTFHGVVCLRLLHRIAEPEERRAVLTELTRIAREWILISFYDRNTSHAARKRRRGRYDGINRKTFGNEVASTGWKVVRFHGMRRFLRTHSQTLAWLAPTRCDP